MITVTHSQIPTNSEAIVVFYNKEGELSFHNKKIDELYSKFHETKVLSDEKGSVISSFIEIDGVMTCIVFSAVGENKKITSNSIQRATYVGVKESLKYKPKTIAICLFEKTNLIQQQRVVEGAFFAGYRFAKYHFEPEEETDWTIQFVKKDGMDKLSLTNGEITALNIFSARNIVNEPANNMTPEHLAQYVVENQNKGYIAEIFDEQEIKNLGMGAFYAVAQGSDYQPRLIVMKYMGCPESKEIIGLIGKGLTYDSGGYSLKPSDSMRTMKADMGGAASVIAAVNILAETKAKVNVVAVVAACENLISGHSYKPGDIICSMAGKYIEIDNTDAEGRLTLIDAVTYALRKQNATTIVDVATLTGAAVAALGKEYTAIITNDDDMLKVLYESSEISGDKVWQLPTDENFASMNKSQIADLKNRGGSFGGTITAGMFIGEFVEGKPWVHLDIAGPAIVDDDKIFCGSGATGVPTTLLCEFTKKYFSSHL